MMPNKYCLNRLLNFALLFLSILLNLKTIQAQPDTLQGFQQKILGEEIEYYSPLHQFAKTTLLTRANGNMPVSFEAPVYTGIKSIVTYELLIGHSTGTSSGEREFEVSLNEVVLFRIKTPMHQKGFYKLENAFANHCSYTFMQQDYDINWDAFGKLYLNVPANLVQQKAQFKISGLDMNSRDWLMVFMYQKSLKMIAAPVNLVTRKESKRQLNLYFDNPYSSPVSLHILVQNENFYHTLQSGFNKLSIAAFDTAFTGTAKISCIINQKDTIYETVTLKRLKNYDFHIIHHSHNDIGYSHLQTEVEKIQSRNIATAIAWIKNNKNSDVKPVWHIESLWAVENYLNGASTQKTNEFIEMVKGGQLVLSANYANILTGICQQEELNWALEYAGYLQKTYGIGIQNVMTTDIPGLSYSGFLSYVNNGIPYLSFGPNYVSTLPDKGDRIGSMIKEQGDKAFYWKPDSLSTKKLLVWTAGKGYSYFHGIPQREQQQMWEQRISDYCGELMEGNYPYEMVQLRYTKNSDNGPVDTMLAAFVKNWNEVYRIPHLSISNLNNLFKTFEEKYGKTIPVKTGEIAPYWEDGAYSTAQEEIANRQLAIKTIAMEKFARSKNLYAKNEVLFYRLHRSMVLFQEHTWGSWCSISDPEIAFTTEQWKIKKSFIDSGLIYYEQLSKLLKYSYTKPALKTATKRIENFQIDSMHGGLSELNFSNKNLVSQKGTYRLFEPVYSSGLNPMQIKQAKVIGIKQIKNDALLKVIEVISEIPTLENLNIIYTLNKKQGTLICRYQFDKTAVKEKESFHIAMPFELTNAQLTYGSDQHLLNTTSDQLAGSNKEFICVETNVQIKSEEGNVHISCPEIALYEIGEMIDENKTNGVKTWKKEQAFNNQLFLYVLNNYWHTNYKAYQDGHFDFEIELQLE